MNGIGKGLIGFGVVLVVLIVLGTICTTSTSGLVNNASHFVVAQSNLELAKDIRYMAGTIDKSVTANTISTIAMAITLLGVLVLAFFGLRAYQRNHAAGGGDPFFGSPALPKSLAMGGDARRLLRRMNRRQKEALLERLDEITAVLEADLGYVSEDQPEGILPYRNDAQTVMLPPRWK